MNGGASSAGLASGMASGLSTGLSPRGFAAWALALLVLQLVGLGGVPLFDVDEGAFAEATREMLASGDWGHTTLNGEDRWDKPILTYWLQAASVWLFGLDTFALRLPSALAAWLWAVVVAQRVSQSHGGCAGLAAGTLLSSSLGVMLIGRAATADALLNLWLALAMLSLWQAMQDLGPTPPADARPLSERRRTGLRALRFTALWIALGLLTKGPVALLIPAATLGLWSLASSGPRWPRLRPLLCDGPAWLVLIGVALPWYAHALDRHGMAFVDGFLWRHNLQRYGGTLEGHAGTWSYYLLLLPLLMLPWTALLLPLLARLRRLWGDPADRFLLLWAGFVLVFFSASGTKLPHYGLYGITPLAMLAGRWLAGPVEMGGVGGVRVGGVDRLARILLVSTLALLPMGALWLSDLAQSLIAASTRPADALHALLLAGPGLLDNGAGRQRLYAATFIGTLLGLCAWLGLRMREGSAPRAAVPMLSAVTLTLGLTQVLLPWWGERLQGPVVALARIARAQHPDQTVVQWGLHQPSFALYLGRPTPRRAPKPDELALVRVDRLDTLVADDGMTGPVSLGASPAMRVVARATGYLLIERSARTAGP